MLLELCTIDAKDEKAKLAENMNKRLCYLPKIKLASFFRTSLYLVFVGAWGSNFEPSH